MLKNFSKKKKIVILIVLIFCILLVITLKFAPNKMTYSIEKQGEKYFVSISDNRGTVIYEDLYSSEPIISKVGKNSIIVTVGGGDFWQSQFINGKTGKVSESFENVRACNEKIVVYGIYEEGNLKIIIRDIYNKDEVYKEIIDEFPDIAAGSYLIKDARVMNNHLVYLNYYLGNDWKTKKKIIFI